MKRGLLVGICAALAAAFVAPSALGANFKVWDGANGACAGYTHTTIQGAVDAAALTPGADTITVCQGTYPENVVVSTSNLTIQAKNNAPDVLSCNATRTDLTTPANVKKYTIVDGSGGPAGFRLHGNKITLTGFVLQNVLDDAAVSTDPGFSGYVIQQNLFQDNTIGLYFQSGGSTQSKVPSNCFRENNNGFPVSSSAGTAIYSDAGLKNALIQGNRFYNNASAAVTLLDPLGLTLSGIQVKGNLMLNNVADAQPGTDEAYTFAIIEHSTGSEISGNILKGGTWNGSAIFVAPENSGLKIKGNIIQKSGTAAWYRGIHVRNDCGNFTACGTSTKLEISGNIVQGMQLDGLRVAPDSMTLSTVSGNIFTNNGFDEPLEAGDGIKVNSASFCTIFGSCNAPTNPGGLTTDNGGNIFKGNIATGNAGHDCHDATNGTLTGGTANTWQGNIGKRANRAGICFPGNQVVLPFEHDPYP